eukprot:1140294-Pelagomonas_calceolata.AAC.2
MQTSGTCTSNTRPGQQEETAQRQQADLCKNVSGKAVTLCTILLGVGGTCYNAIIFSEYTKAQLIKLGLDHQRASELAQGLHAHSVKFAHKLMTRRAIENKNNPHSQARP